MDLWSVKFDIQDNFKNIFSSETSETNLKLSLTRISEYISICFEIAIENDLLIIKIKSIIS